MLYVYRASAGSGKTHLLTGFYLKLLFRKDLAVPEIGRPALFKEILAVTFTNKATAEMKSRIIEELELLSRRPSDSDYYPELNPGEAEPEEVIRKRAATIMNRLLNDYTDFNISTIDSFFQRIVRSFARELNLQGNYEIELDASRILEAAVNSFVNKLDRDTDKELFDWMLSFSRERISEGSSWDFKRELLAMAQVLVSEEYRRYSDRICAFTEDKKALKEYTGVVKRKIHDFRAALKKQGEEGLALLGRYGLAPDDFSRGSGSAVAILSVWAQGIVKEPTATLYKWAENADGWFAKTSKLHGKLPQEATDAILGMLQNAVALFGDDYRDFLSAQAILQNIYQLGILADIDREMREYCAEQGLMLLSGTTELLNRLVDADSSPFIYEKIGTRIRHFMIDEFQDTSGMQWENFKPLLSNALAEGSHNLIVGDVKQSIYRWRGSDWGLLHSGLDNYETALRRDDNTTLRTNWRSASEIIRFNNDFFRLASGKLEGAINAECESPGHDITRIYSDVAQQVPSRRRQQGEGLVHVEFVEGETVTQQREAAMERLPELIIELEKNGYEPRDIAILGRRKDICAQSVETLLRYKEEHPESPYCMDIISNEALLLSSRPVIQTLVGLLQHINNPESEIIRAMAAANYFQLSGCTMSEALQRYFENPEIHPRLREIASRPIYEMVEELIAILPSAAVAGISDNRSGDAVVNDDVPFLEAFRDLVLEFIHGRTPNLPAFLEWWEEYGIGKSIATPADQNAIRVMTIHQAKGLGMPAVIIPFASWPMDIKARASDLLWCEPKEGGFARDNLVLPIRLSKELPRTIFHREYEEERLRTMIDNLNTAYVAFTRPKEALIMLAPTPAKKAETTLERLIADYAGQDTGIFTNGLWARSGDSLRNKVASSSGVSSSDDHGRKGASRISGSGSDSVRGEFRLPRLSLKQSRLKKEDEKIRRGNCIHTALSAVTTVRDVDWRIDVLYNQGLLDETLIGRGEMKKMLYDLVRLPEAADWFGEENTVLNEQTILCDNDDVKRPDRIVMRPDGTVIVIDYKTGQERSGYRAQVRTYMKLLSAMGFGSVRGYLWYIDTGKIEAV